MLTRATRTCVIVEVLGEFRQLNGDSNCQYSNFGKPFAGFTAEAMKILVVDPKIEAGQTVAEQVTSMGHEAAIAWTAANAIEAAAEWIPDAALLDIGLGEDDAHEVCRTLRSNPDLSRCKIIALSGTSTLDFLALSLFDAILEKPVDAPTLVSLLGSGSNDSSSDG
ncbi:hypothetical protein [Paraburkholderia terricola]|uniref:hypothetical protein n=1 Tax=Paraburkholderia terricola TaxID=169427 RepID=UPI001FD39940|nr:hypothetical protein [Paraburkholderia terricola]